MKLYCVQLDIAWEDKAANHARVTRLIEQAAPEPGSLLLLPEMFATGFSMNVGFIDDGTAGPTQQFLSGLARDLRVYVLGGLVTRSEQGRGRNQAVLYGPQGAEAARYTKLHPFSHGQEHLHYEPGSRVVTFAWGGVPTIAPFICYDLRFPEAFRAAARRGAQVMAVIANWPVAREGHWLTLLCARAIENQCYVAGVNRCGRDPNVGYRGRSRIIDPCGNVIADAGSEEGVISAGIDLVALEGYRRDFPVLQDARDDLLPGAAE